MLAAGQLNTRVTIEQRGIGQDVIGQPIDSWVPLAVVWGNVRYPSGTAAIKSSADVSTVQASVRIRYRQGLDAGLRLTADGRVFNVAAVLPNRAEGYIDLVCEVTQ